MVYEVVPEGHGYCLHHLGSDDICLGITGEMVCHYWDIFLLSLPWLQAKVINVHWFQGMGTHDILHGNPLLLCLEGDTLAALLDVFFYLYSHLRSKEMVMHQVNHLLEN